MNVTVNNELYEALIEAGVGEKKAQKAAQSVAGEQLATKRDISRLNLLVTGIYIAGAVGFGYVFASLNTIISKI